VTRTLGFGSAWFDLRVVDGAVNGVGATHAGLRLRRAALSRPGASSSTSPSPWPAASSLAAWLILS
jgi:hypothetical protein